ncbi:hypothetical protein ACRE_033140 [Hapsidospora chrysogenum ATCC 11550]|uniref:Uncharacterized protein n=1 Tax=Hapsidospora chrysogenum (strain ATCC 11550 / CBS 779.69 / DSM 880 / IAM 14645 / JCM 23072 / IMI 49137) TaxID=857340 RepID=A0A086T902_HAPC1|nr:hypothetical protein ACRE_033140 [Hapsidospora chrysogenum ATCC 11550]
MARRRRSHDTGFPEPFNEDYNTTLPHPEANLSPNAFISSDSLSAPHLLERRRTSILLKHRRTKGLPTLMTDMMGGGREDHADDPTPPSSGTTTTTTTTTTDGSLESCTRGGGYEHDTPPTSPDIPSRRRSILDRFRPNKSRAKKVIKPS